MKILPLYSGSNGNASLIKSQGGTVLVDGGVGIRNLQNALAQNGESIFSICALILTHSHTDHVKGVQKLIFNRPDLKVFGGKTTERFAMCANFSAISEGEAFHCGGMEITPFQVPHDVECFGYTFSCEEEKISYITDLGTVSEKTYAMIEGSKKVMIESNYDEFLLSSGSYPRFLQSRISGSHGHLSNTQTKEVCKRLLSSGTREFVLAHLSENSNTPEIAYKETKDHLEETGAKLFCDFSLRVAKRMGELEI